MPRDEMVVELNLLYLQAHRSKDSYVRLAAKLISDIIRGLAAQVADRTLDVLYTPRALDSKEFVGAVQWLAERAKEPSMEMSFPIVRIALLHIALVVETRRVVI